MGSTIKTIRLLAGMCLLAISVSAQNIDVKGTPWEGDEILKTPAYRVVAEDSGPFSLKGYRIRGIRNRFLLFMLHPVC